jgi:hypothetical protein
MQQRRRRRRRQLVVLLAFSLPLLSAVAANSEAVDDDDTRGRVSDEIKQRLPATTSMAADDGADDYDEQAFDVRLMPFDDVSTQYRGGNLTAQRVACVQPSRCRCSRSRTRSAWCTTIRAE